MRIAQIIGWLPKREAAAPRSEQVPAFARRPQWLFAVFLQLSLLFIAREKRHSNHDHSPHLRSQEMAYLDRLDGAGVHAKAIDMALQAACLRTINGRLSLLF